MRFLEKTSLARGYDWITIILVITITAIGFAAIYSVDLSKGSELVYVPNQFISFILGFIALLVLGRMHSTVFFASAKWIYILAVLLLILVLFFGVNIRGTTGWFRILGFSFQPSEFAKFALIVWLGWWITRQGRGFEKWQFIVSSGFVTFLLVCLVLLQPDLGSAAVLISIWFGLLFLTRTKKMHIIILLGTVVISFVLGWTFLFKDYQKERLMTFFDPSRDPLGSGYNVIQSGIAIGSGGFLGRGLGFGSQSQLHFLPEAQTDFVFSVIAEELGFVGVLLVLGLFFALILRLIWLASECRDDFSTFFILGVAVLFLVQIIVNVGAATGILPVTGVTLPFLSYGGSSLIINFMLVGIVQSVIRSLNLSSSFEF
ncbi:MAG: rod shape-determining protein RodA [Candidatus Magasanikbacteria bacterium CG_4_9_14_3_um_filter_32_9]|uniref:Rod shape-determining protein RodA n=1 Tax=Candidatus Magasanikbacteria bacterium CG_4_9_14_3_um_filter_32_9 TaxID=1974644 RepID=A0A2M7Z650_9BACT|nr:MAG: rod shape-determining protein RodA [Candidatus Magasanikbacteria bacterium CG_4_9_14_3_um_filter_32_9]